MSDTPPPRRIAPEGGPHLWTAEAMSPADWMMPLGAEAVAESLFPPGVARPVLDPLLSRLAERLAHGRGFVLLRGLPSPEDARALLVAFGERLGQVVPSRPPEEGPLLAVPADILLLLCREATRITLLSAAAVHNALMKADRAALEVFHRPLPLAEDRDVPVFAVQGGVFSGWLDRAALEHTAPAAAVRALDDAMAIPGLALTLPLRPGDLLCLNPFLVWATRAPGLEMLALRVGEESRLTHGAFVTLAS